MKENNLASVNNTLSSQNYVPNSQTVLLSLQWIENKIPGFYHDENSYPFLLFAMLPFSPDCMLSKNKWRIYFLSLSPALHVILSTFCGFLSPPAIFHELGKRYTLWICPSGNTVFSYFMLENKIEFSFNHKFFFNFLWNRSVDLIFSEIKISNTTTISWPLFAFLLHTKVMIYSISPPTLFFIHTKLQLWSCTYHNTVKNKSLKKVWIC